MGFALLLHTLAATIWVGGMFFALVCLRPRESDLDAAARVKLWTGALSRFFPWVWGSVGVLLATGLWMTFQVLGGMREAGLHVHLMLGLGILMMLLAAHVYFAPFRRLKLALSESHWADAGKRLNQIRAFMTVNLALGLVVIAIGSGGRYLFR